MKWLDWTVLGVLTGGLTCVSLYTVRYMKSVADFLSANRSAGRYLVAISGSMAGIGAITVVGMFEVYGKRGFPPLWWTNMKLVVSALMILSGWVYYRFRETRCMTMAQFYEVRYSKGVRVYAGIITWLSGIVNFGIFPAVAARFFVYFCGLPPTFAVMGISIPTFAPIMTVTLGMALIYTCLGGQITVMVTDCVQGIFCSVAFVIICLLLLHRFPWPDIVAALQTAQSGASMLHPYQTGDVPDFNAWFFLIAIFGTFYGYMSWQGRQGYFSSALNPHEQKMGRIIGMWREIPVNLLVVLIPICAFTFLALPKHAAGAAQVQAVLKTIKEPAIATQMLVPVALAHILPMGIKGLFCAIMIFFLITTQDTYLHSWGSIFIQDVILPFRRKPLRPEQHVRLLRWSIVSVGVFAFFFSLLFKQTEYILMFFAITGAIVSGAGAMIIGGLYWKRGTTAAAYFAMTLGWVMAIGRIALTQIAPLFKDVTDRGILLQFMDRANAINSQVIWFYIMLTCVVSYVMVSLITHRKPFNLDRMLHRGKYSTKGEHAVAKDAAKSVWWKLTGITKEFTRTDRFLAIALLLWNLSWFTIFIIGTIYNVMINKNVTEDSWAKFWHVWIWLQLIIGIPITVWFTLGGIRDIRRVFARLATLERNDLDDGRVVDHHVAGEEQEQEEQ